MVGGHWDEELWLLGRLASCGGTLGVCGVKGKWICKGWSRKGREWECIWSRMGIRGRLGAVECVVCL